MRKSLWVAPMILLFAVIGTPNAHAATITPCAPSGSTDLETLGGNGLGLDLTGGLGTISNALGTATASPGFASATAVFAAEGTANTAASEYCIVVAGPATSAGILVDVSAGFTATISNATSSANDTVTYFNPSIAPASMQILQLLANSEDDPTDCDNPSGCSLFTDASTSLVVPVNDSLPFLLEVQVDDAIKGTSTGTVDPVFTIDPSNPNADEYSIIVSAGVNNSPITPTPEPSTFGLMLIGIGLIGLVMRKRIAQGLAQTS